MFEGSMVGAGCPTFAVWSYVITKMREDREVGAQVDLNPVLLSAILGEKAEVIERVIEKLCEPDARSRTPDEEGRRLVKVGTFSYRVVNGAKYIAIRNADQKRASDRERQRKKRAKGNGAPLPGERAFEQAVERGDEAGAQQILESHVPHGTLERKSDGKRIMPVREAGEAGGKELPGVPRQGAERVAGEEPAAQAVPPLREATEPAETFPEIPSGVKYPVQEEPEVQSGRFVDGEWVPD
jgi:hypothetical protein